MAFGSHRSGPNRDLDPSQVVKAAFTIPRRQAGAGQADRRGLVHGELVGCQIGNQLHDYLVLLLRLDHPALEVVPKLAGPEAPCLIPASGRASEE